MNETEDTNQQKPERSTLEKTRPAIRFTLFFGIVGSAVAIGTLFDTIASRFLGDIHSNAECCRDYQAYKQEDSSQRRFWVRVIEELRNRDTDHDSTLSKLRTEIEVSKARLQALERIKSIPDGSKLEKSLKEIRNEIKALKNNNEP